MSLTERELLSIKFLRVTLSHMSILVGFEIIKLVCRFADKSPHGIAADLSVRRWKTI